MKTTGHFEFFGKCVVKSLTRINNLNPELLDEIEIGLEEVPSMTWQENRVPLAVAVAATEDQPAQIVLFRRPLERRAINKRQLAELVHLTLIEQLAALTGKSPEDIDPNFAEND